MLRRIQLLVSCSSFFGQKILIFKNYQVFTLDISEEVVREGGGTNTVKYEC